MTRTEIESQAARLGTYGVFTTIMLADSMTFKMLIAAIRIMKEEEFIMEVPFGGVVNAR